MTWLERTASWLGIILISLSWRAALHLVTAPDAALALMVIFTGLACLVLSADWSRRHARSSYTEILAAASAAFLVSGVSAGLLLRLAPFIRAVAVPHRLAPIVEGLSGRLGLLDGLVTFWDGRGLEVVRITFEGLGLYEIWFITAGGAAAMLVSGSRARWRELAIAMALIPAFALLRFGVLVALAMEMDRPAALWHPVVAILSYVPLAPIAVWAYPRAPLEHGVSARRLLVLAGAALAILAGTTFPRFAAECHPVPARRARVLIDESHSDWEWAGEPFDTTSFGIRAEYNYSCFAGYLGEFCDVRVGSDSVTAGGLAGLDVLIVKTPTEAYSRAEISAIVEFVKGGGGLLLIGDHTNLFGMATYLNPLAERFGMRFCSDDTFDLATGGFSSHVDMGFWTHPAMRGVRGFRFLTSCTVEGGIRAEPVMLGMGLGSEEGDYGHPNFFGNISYDLADRFGVFLQAAGRRFGRGRVLLFTDSTCFSNFCMFSPATADVARRFLEYLGCSAQGESAAVRGPFTGTVLVDTVHSRASFFDYIGHTGRPGWQGFEEFFISIARLGMRPVPGDIAGLERSRAAALAIVNPRRGFARDELERLLEFVECGGRLLVMDGVANSASTANDLLAAFRMRIAMRPVFRGGSLMPGLEILGGEPLAADSAGRVSAAAGPFGSGRVVVAVDSYEFCEAGLGRPLGPAGAYQANRPRYRRLFDILQELR